MKKIILSLFLCSQSLSAKPLRIAILAVLDDGHFEQPVIELFREVESVSQNLSDWQIVSRKEILDALAQQNLNILPLPVISTFQFQKGLLKSKSKEIPVLQKILDNSDIQGAILVRCETENSSEVRSCGLYLYDRTASKTISSSTKIFDQPVTNTKVWATPLITKLHQGLKESKVKKERDTLQNLFDEENTLGQRSLSLQTSLGIATLKDPNAEIKSVPYLKLGIGAQFESYGVNAIYGFSRSKVSPVGSTIQYTEQCYGVNAGARVKSLDTIYWGLEISALVSEKKVIRTSLSDSNGDGYQSDRSLKIALTPVLLWSLGDSILLGLESSIAKESALANSNTGVYQKAPIESTGIALGLRFQTIIR